MEVIQKELLLFSLFNMNNILFGRRVQIRSSRSNMNWGFRAHEMSAELYPGLRSKKEPKSFLRSYIYILIYLFWSYEKGILFKMHGFLVICICLSI